MAKKKKCPEGLPEWLLTYGDMMSLLLCFFIMLVAFMEPKKPPVEIQKTIETFQRAYLGGVGMTPIDDLPLTVIQKSFELALQREKQKNKSKANDPGIKGKTTTVTRIREGLLFTVGGYITFEPGSADLKPEGIAEIKRIAESVRGHNNKIEIRGHTSTLELDENGPFKSLWELSYARAQVVMNVLTAPEQGIRPQRVRLIACGDHEPLVRRVLERNRQAVNRRVEVIVNEALVDELTATDDAHVDAID